MVGVEEQLLEAAGVAQDLLGHGGQGAVALVHVLHLPIAALEYWNALEHGGSADGSTVNPPYKTHTKTHANGVTLYYMALITPLPCSPLINLSIGPLSLCCELAAVYIHSIQ